MLNALRDIRAAVSRRTGAEQAPVIAVVSEEECIDRCVAALNFALAAARDGARVLMIDADHKAHRLSDKVARHGKTEPNRLGWLSIGSRSSRAIETANGIAILPSLKGDETKAVIWGTRPFPSRPCWGRANR